MIDQLDISIKIHKRVLVYQFILHTNYYTPDSKRVTNLMKNLKQKIGRDYGIKHIGYAWFNSFNIKMQFIVGINLQYIINRNY